MNRKKIAFLTFGCKLNFAETSEVSKLFNIKNFEIVSHKDIADIYIINSCSVTAKAESKCRQAIRHAKKINPEAFIAVIGCYSQLKPDELEKMEGVNLVIGNDLKFKLPDFLQNPNNLDNNKTHLIDILKSDQFNPSFSASDRTRSFLKIQDGCDYFCSYCTIPYARGLSRSDSIENIIKSADNISELGIKEIILTGVNIGDFGRNNNESLYELIVELNKVEAIERIRISSIEPDLLTDEIIKFVASSPKFLPHFHIPLQSGSDKILKAMNRKYERQLFADKILKIKTLMPESCIAADVIVGFPGETNDDFIETYEFIKNLDISYVHVFSYSDRENAKSIHFSNKIQGKTIKERSKKLHQLSLEKKLYFCQQNIGRTEKVLFESNNYNDFMLGWTENYIRVKTKYNSELINKILTVELNKFDENGVFLLEKI